MKRPTCLSHEDQHAPQLLFSVVIPCFNDGAYVFEAVESCLRQDCSFGVEVIIVDDGSDDGSAEKLIQEYRNNDRVKLILQENSGPSAARNNGVRHASGDFILFLDADDKVGGQYFSYVEDALVRSGGLRKQHLVVSPYSYFPSESSLSRSFMVYFRAPRLISGWRSFNRFCILTGNCFPISSCVISRGLVNAVEGFDENLRHHEDWDFWIRILDINSSVIYTDAGYSGATYIRMRQGMMSNVREMKLSQKMVLLRHTKSKIGGLLRGRVGWFSARVIRASLLVCQLILMGKDQNLKAR